LEGKLGLQYKFCLQYEDPDFKNALVNLADIADLPEQPTIKILSLIVAEFCRVSSKNLKIEFFKELDKYIPRLFDIFKSKGGSFCRKLEGYLQQVAPAGTDVNDKRTAVLRGLPVILGDENNDFLKTCF
ncbi:Thiamine-monophosphate kinase, partial [Dissostichus eleginoides]